MTYIRIRTDKGLSSDVECALRADICDLLFLLGKSPNQCMIDVESKCNIRMADGTGPCVYIDLQFAVMPEDDEIRAFTKEAAKLFTDALNVSVDCMYLSYTQIRYGATGAVLSR